MRNKYAAIIMGYTLMFFLSCVNQQREDQHSSSLKGLSPRIDSCRILNETTKITYCDYTGSEEAKSTKVELYPDYVVWQYCEARNQCELTDSCKYDRCEFNKMLFELSLFEFYISKDTFPPIVGGGGYIYSFETAKDCYLSYNNCDHLSGRYQKVERV